MGIKSGKNGWGTYYSYSFVIVYLGAAVRSYRHDIRFKCRKEKESALLKMLPLKSDQVAFN
jgi:hypothetical protein